MTFEVKAEASAMLAFMVAKEDQSADAIELVLGDFANTRSLLEIGTGQLAQQPPAAVSNVAGDLDKNEFKPFWVTLDKKTMTVGRGREIGSQIMFQPTLVPTLGTKGFLYIGFASAMSTAVFRYKGATVSCMHVQPQWHPTPTTPPKPPVPVPCQVGKWQYPNASIVKDQLCSTKCGGGFYTVRRDVIVQPANGGAACPSDLEKQVDCNTQPCPSCCSVSEWNSWSECTQQCGSEGTQTKTRKISADRTSNCDYSQCPNEQSMTRPCNRKSCPRPCILSDWSEWSPCPSTCGGGTTTRRRYVKQSPIGDGYLCEALEETDSCNVQQCEPKCKVSSWSLWSKCDKECGGTPARVSSHAS